MPRHFDTLIFFFIQLDSWELHVLWCADQSLLPLHVWHDGLDQPHGLSVRARCWIRSRPSWDFGADSAGPCRKINNGGLQIEELFQDVDPIMFLHGLQGEITFPSAFSAFSIRFGAMQFQFRFQDWNPDCGSSNEEAIRVKIFFGANRPRRACTSWNWRSIQVFLQILVTQRIFNIIFRKWHPTSSNHGLPYVTIIFNKHWWSLMVSIQPITPSTASGQSGRPQGMPSPRIPKRHGRIKIEPQRQMWRNFNDSYSIFLYISIYRLI